MTNQTEKEEAKSDILTCVALPGRNIKKEPIEVADRERSPFAVAFRRIASVFLCWRQASKQAILSESRCRVGITAAQHAAEQTTRSTTAVLKLANWRRARTNINAVSRASEHSELHIREEGRRMNAVETTYQIIMMHLVSKYLKETEARLSLTKEIRGRVGWELGM